MSVHEKVNVICDNLCLEEGMTKAQIEDGLNLKANISDVKLKGDFAVLTGSFQCEANSSGSASGFTTTFEVIYPTGYTSDNSVVISFGRKIDAAKGYTFGTGDRENTTALILGATSSYVYLQSTKIAIYATNYSTSARMLYYKIVLMRTD